MCAILYRVVDWSLRFGLCTHVEIGKVLTRVLLLQRNSKAVVNVVVEQGHCGCGANRSPLQSAHVFLWASVCLHYCMLSLTELWHVCEGASAYLCEH